MTQLTIFDLLNVDEPEPEYTDGTRMILDIFRDQESKYIDRAALRELVQVRSGRYVPDRTMRKMIETARQEGVVICNGQDGAGYFLPTTKEELKRQFDQNESRALSIMRQQKFIRREMQKWTSAER